MSTSPEHGDALLLPHANLLTYVRLSITTPQELPDKDTAPPPYTSDNTLLSHGVDEDEEAHCSFRAKFDSSKSRRTPPLHHCIEGQITIALIILCFVWVIIMIYMYITLDSSWASSTGFVKYDMRFCLVSPNHQVPGPQIWRYITAAGVAECTTEVLTLSARSSDIWKMRYGDEMSFGEEIRPKKAEERMGVEDLGDDLATEGGGRALDVYPGRYRRH